MEKYPFKRASVVDVELYPVFEVNGNTCADKVDVGTDAMIPFEPMYE